MQTNEKFFSLILATLGREHEIEQILNSLKNQLFKDFEVIIIDQNSVNFIAKIVDKYKESIDINHIRTELKGLSRARNIGIKVAQGKYYSFPDDDCQYASNTLSVVKNLFESDTKISAIKGRIIDFEGNDALKKWRKKKFKIQKYHIPLVGSSITMFVSRKIVSLFDEKLGAGTEFGSSEDFDFLYQILDRKGKVMYYPEVILYHPNESALNLEVAKIINYGRGFGAYIRKNISLQNIVILNLIILYHLFSSFYFLCSGKSKIFKKKIKYVTSRIEGFMKYEN